MCWQLPYLQPANIASFLPTKMLCWEWRPQAVNEAVDVDKSREMPWDTQCFVELMFSFWIAQSY